MSKSFKYSDIEKQKNKELDSLFDEWISQLSKNQTIVKNGDKDKKTPKDCFAKDGFFPGYFAPNNQGKRVVFIGRETRSIGGDDFRETSKAFFENENVNVNKNNWWRHILKIVYGIKKEGKENFKKVPSAREIIDDMYKGNNFGFAVINISKFSNDNENNWQSNKKLIHRFIQDSKLEETHFFEKELEILEPDIIITGNLWDRKIIKSEDIDLCLPKSNFLETKNIGKNIAEYGKYNLSGRLIDFIDLYHFSANKSEKDCFYDPVMKVLFNKNRK